MDLLSQHAAANEGALGGFLATVISIIVTSLFIHFAARIVLDRAPFSSALLTAVISSFLAQLVINVFDFQYDWLLAIFVWAGVTAAFYRTKWTRGALIGITAWLLWWLANLLIQQVLG